MRSLSTVTRGAQVASGELLEVTTVGTRRRRNCLANGSTTRPIAPAASPLGKSICRGASGSTTHTVHSGCGSTAEAMPDSTRRSKLLDGESRAKMTRWSCAMGMPRRRSGRKTCPDAILQDSDVKRQ